MKTMDEIYGEMRAYYTEQTGMEINDSCDMAVRMKAAAAQIYSLYVYNDWVKRQCFPQTASGEHLDYHAQMRGITRNAATFAKGKIRFKINETVLSDISIAPGTVCMTAGGIEFQTEDSGIIEAGNLYCDVNSIALVGGESGNVSENSISFMTQAPIGVSACTNIARFTGGADAESDDSLRKRILASYNRLPNGANAAYYEKIVMDMEDVAAVKVISKGRGLGKLDIIVSSASGVPSSELISRISSKLDAMREICVDINVIAPVCKTVDLSVKLDTGERDFSGVSELVKSELRKYFDGKILGKSIYLAKLGDVIFKVPGVENYKILAPSSDVKIENNEIAVCGTVTVSEWS